jgi:type VI secretion system protein ImpJ
MPERQVAVQLPTFAKIAAVDDIQSILRAATPGAPVEVEHRPPPEVPLRPGQVHFEIDTHNAYFHKAREERALAVYLPPFYAPSRTELTLFGIGARTPSRAAFTAPTPPTPQTSKERT